MVAVDTRGVRSTKGIASSEAPRLSSTHEAEVAVLMDAPVLGLNRTAAN